MNPRAYIIPKHFYSLDALRGIAALSVVFWHWQHFFFDGTKQSTAFAIARQPLYGLFEPFYRQGWRAVDLFFCLSGFIFFWLFSEAIARRETSAREFFVLRFSRLYPLHSLTLLLVAAAQGFIRWRSGSYFVYAPNAAFHFALQTVFASNWGFGEEQTFNGPVWSVSVEVLCYVVFFLGCFLRLNRWWLLGVFAAVGCCLQAADLPLVGRGVFSFFMGGLAFRVFGLLVRRGLSADALHALGIGVGVLWVLIPLNFFNQTLYFLYESCLGANDPGMQDGDNVGWFLLRSSGWAFEAVLFPATIITLALYEAHRGTLGKRLAARGNISSSSYLLPFPLQLLYAGVAASLSVPRDFFYRPWVLGLFFAALLPLSLGSYRYFERPCQSLLRRWALRPQGVRVPPAGLNTPLNTSFNCGARLNSRG